MGENSPPWASKKFDPSTINIFWIYKFSSLDILKFVAFHKSWHQCDVSHTQKQKVNWFSQQLQFYHKKFENFGKIMGNWCWVPLIYLIFSYFVTVISTFDTASSVSVVNSSAEAFFVLSWIFICSSSLS